jgi:hypothetical protein
MHHSQSFILFKKREFGSHNFNILEFQIQISKQGAQVLMKKMGQVGGSGCDNYSFSRG